MSLERACGAPVAAAKLFVLHLRASGTQFIALHFDDFRCGNRDILCGGNECLHEVYVRSGSSFRLVFGVRAVDIRMTNERDVAGFEVTIAGRNPSTVVYKWDGSRFVMTDAPTKNRR